MSKYPWQGIQIRIHPTFWAAICLSVWTGHFIEILTLFVLVVIHELGHITAAGSYGWRVRSLELLPFGGVAKMEEWGTVPTREELVVALAGPFYHIWIILISLLFYLAGLWSHDWTEYFIIGNLWIAGFNLLPIYPLDGGRVFQAVISYFFSYRESIRFSLWMSLILSVILLLFSLAILHLPLCLIASFLFFANLSSLRQKEYQYLRFLFHRFQFGVKGYPPVQDMSVTIDETLATVMKKWYKERYHVFQVCDHNGENLRSIPEEVLLTWYFSKREPKATMREWLLIEAGN